MRKWGTRPPVWHSQSGPNRWLVVGVVALRDCVKEADSLTTGSLSVVSLLGITHFVDIFPVTLLKTYKQASSPVYSSVNGFSCSCFKCTLEERDACVPLC